MNYTIAPDDAVFLSQEEAYEMRVLLRHTISQCEARDVEDFPMPVTLESLRNMLAHLDR